MKVTTVLHVVINGRMCGAALMLPLVILTCLRNKDSCVRKWHDYSNKYYVYVTEKFVTTVILNVMQYSFVPTYQLHGIKFHVQKKKKERNAADRQSTSLSWYRASLWGPWPDLYFFTFILFPMASSLTRKWVCSLECLHSLVRSLNDQ
jgi:hypothetical protein